MIAGAQKRPNLNKINV